MQQIPLSQGQIAVIDDDDFADIARFKWFYRAERNGKPGYAVRNIKVDGKATMRYLHREIMNPTPGHEVIFLNHDRLDCRKENLRAVTTEEARQHHRMRSDCKTGAKGVRYNGDTGTWSAYLYRYGNAYHVGTFYFKEQAEQAYQEALRRENPDLHSAPAVVERRIEPQTAEQEPVCSASKA